jgi:predicted ester cyclase
MSVEENKAIVRQFIEAADRHSTEGVDQIMSPDVLKQFEERAAWVPRMFPGHRIRIADMVAEGDQVWIRLATSGGYAGGWMDIPATDGQWNNTCVAFIQLSEGKVVKFGLLCDLLGHLRQLGAKVVPATSEDEQSFGGA